LTAPYRFLLVYISKGAEGDVPFYLTNSFVSAKQAKKNNGAYFPKVILCQHPHKNKSRRQHQADKGGLSIIESIPWVRSNSIVPSKN
jgi:hypothetical protein